MTGVLRRLRNTARLVTVRGYRLASPERAALRFGQLHHLADEHVHLMLDLRYALHLNVQLHIDVIEVGHHHVEDVILMERSSKPLWSLAASLPEFPTASDWSRWSACALRPSLALLAFDAPWSSR